MTSLKTLALAATAMAGLGLFSMDNAEARGFGRHGGGFHGGGHRHGGLHFGGGHHFGGRHFHHGHRHHGHRHHGHRHHGRWIGAGIGLGLVGGAVLASDCYRYRWVDTPYGLVRRTVNVCGY
ncbi:hypothetical protein [Phreatobacter stygius]|uniref:Sulfur globule protein n=1 Tax=Phreatobacter stygius TaxID=1940610 RepID=A0A4D7BAX9_9HYPH|nr:hypothetical protein [Phreatobacter stygius]QCI67925.1 hypothetical protein E8M01_29050 [Phreatobacter stygius]